MLWDSRAWKHDTCDRSNALYPSNIVRGDELEQEMAMLDACSCQLVRVLHALLVSCNVQHLEEQGVTVICCTADAHA